MEEIKNEEKEIIQEQQVQVNDEEVKKLEKLTETLKSKIETLENTMNNKIIENQLVKTEPVKEFNFCKDRKGGN